MINRLALLLAGAVLVAVFGACTPSEAVEVTAKFDDVGDLAKDAPVLMADIQVGRVTDIRLADARAVVDMAIDPQAEVPADVVARVRRTSVLGERIIDLVVPEGVPLSSEPLADGAEISDTVVRSDLENLVYEGSDVLGAIAASDLATMINEGGRGFGGQGEELRTLLGSYNKILGAYADRGEQIKSLIDSMNNFNRTIAADSQAHARAIANTERSFELLDEESARLERAIVSLNRLAVGGKDILDAHLDEMKNFFAQMRVILGVLEGQQDDLRLLLKWAPGHNRNTQLVEYTEFNQVVQDFVICGLNDDPDDPARRCIGDE
ncbi:MAG: MlaD family protein [Actinomycetota bacterium]